MKALAVYNSLYSGDFSTEYNVLVRNMSKHQITIIKSAAIYVYINLDK